MVFLCLRRENKLMFLYRSLLSLDRIAQDDMNMNYISQ